MLNLLGVCDNVHFFCMCFLKKMLCLLLLLKYYSLLSIVLCCIVLYCIVGIVRSMLYVSIYNCMCLFVCVCWIYLSVSVSLSFFSFLNDCVVLCCDETGWYVMFLDWG